MQLLHAKVSATLLRNRFASQPPSRYRARMRAPPETLSDPETVLSFWFGELDAHGRADKPHQDRWWKKDPEFDSQIRVQFAALQRAAVGGELSAWLDAPRSRLAYIIVLDQFSRNMFRDSAGMFAADAQALEATLQGIERGHDRGLALHERVMFYMPLMHSEQLANQERCIALMQELARESSDSARASMLSHVGFAERHRDIVRKFGRFPHRNALVGRPSTAEELEFLAGPGSSF
jgi:uncharacterized protein (DUF924 family)